MNAQVNANREAAIGRIRALLAKTTANGCTESEAIAAAAKAGELMDRYSIALSDTEIKQERCERREATEARHDVLFVAPAIARFCGCKVWHASGRIQYFGLPQDVAVASFLTDLIRNSMDASFRAFLRSPSRPKHVHGRGLRRAFLVAMATRLNARLNEMTAAREASAQTASGTALVVVRNAVVTEQFAALNMKLGRARPVRYRGNDAASAAGRTAGDRVNLTTGIGSNAGALRLSA
jgi:hypothetical protein